MNIPLQGSFKKINKNLQQPRAFMSKTMRGIELGYSILEKQAYALVQSLKHFKSYIGISKLITLLPHPQFKDILVQHDCLERREKWIWSMIRNLNFKPTKLVKGQGLAKLLVTPPRLRVTRGDLLSHDPHHRQ
jgi:hypothetical protein